MQIDSGKPPKQIAADFNIGISTVCEIMKNRSFILERIASGDFNEHRIRNRATSFEIIDTALLDWFRSVPASNMQGIQGCHLLEKSQEFAISLGHILSISM